MRVTSHRNMQCQVHCTLLLPFEPSQVPLSSRSQRTRSALLIAFSAPRCCTPAARSGTRPFPKPFEKGFLWVPELHSKHNCEWLPRSSKLGFVMVRTYWNRSEICHLSPKKKWKRHPHFDAVIHNTSCSIATNANNPFSPSLSSAAPLWPYPAFLPDSVRRPVLLPCALLLVQPSHRQWQAWCRFQQCHLDLDVPKPLVLAGGQGSIARPVHPGV